MRKILLIGLIGAVVLIGFFLWERGLMGDRISETENINENAKILTITSQMKGMSYKRQDIEYEEDDRTFRNYFDPNLRTSLDWIKEKTAGDSNFLCWWDYGHMIRGYTSRDVIIYSPSEDILWTISSKNGILKALENFLLGKK